MEKSPINSSEESKAQPASQKSNTDPSVDNGRKIIEIQKTIEKKSREENDDDAAQWRNEG